jgi:hypothetical protein
MPIELSAQDAIRKGLDIPRYVYDMRTERRRNFNLVILEMQDDGWDVFQFMNSDVPHCVCIVFRKRVN